MQKRYITLLAGCLMMAGSASAQLIANGGFEGTSTGCQYTDNTGFDAKMNGSAYGYSDLHPLAGTGTFYFFNNSCNDTAQSGANFLSMGYSDGVLPSQYTAGSDKFGFKLTDTLTPGRNYLLTFYHKMNPFYGPTSVVVALAKDSGSLGNQVIDSVPPPITTGWIMDTVTFMPDSNAFYLTVRSSYGPTGTPYHYIDLDNFSIDDVTPTAVATITAPASVQFAPNPFKDRTTAILDDKISLPCSVTVYDVTGKVVKVQNNITSRTVTITKEGLTGNLYFVKVTDRESNNYTTKLLVQ